MTRVLVYSAILATFVVGMYIRRSSTSRRRPPTKLRSLKIRDHELMVFCAASVLTVVAIVTPRWISYHDTAVREPLP